MSRDRAARREQRWKDRYDRTQAAMERQSSLVSNEPLARRGPALVIIDGRDGRRYRLRLIAPGEPLSHEGAVNTGIALAALLSRGSWTPRSSNQSWVVRLERQRGPWRGFDTLQSFTFTDVSDAERHLKSLRDALERGEEP